MLKGLGITDMKKPSLFDVNRLSSGFSSGGSMCWRGFGFNFGTQNRFSISVHKIFSM